ncbi:glycosyl hydrolase 108 family protein [Mesorhizobium sp.]|uniref:glycoside hydrolase family 108 protein n=1 Tax=Mesorhizobium sp. TaxID=1871066 RepID=UPI00257FAA28|nr:glycosyl hydrolase 108 family protein [Mesorhizobium sp.]
MDRNFARSLALVLKYEGGWSDHPADPGGATMKGVTLANFRRYVKADATKADLRKITDAQVATVYRRFYWDAVAGAELPDGVDFAVFDFAVNSGPSRAAKYLQAIVGTVQDGRIGPATVKAAKAKSATVIIAGLCDARLDFLKRLNTWGTFGKGWSARVSSVRFHALVMAKQPEPIIIPQTAPDKPSVVVVTQQGNEPPVVTKVPPAPSNRWTGLIAMIAVIAAAIAAFFGWR